MLACLRFVTLMFNFKDTFTVISDTFFISLTISSEGNNQNKRSSFSLCFTGEPEVVSFIMDP